MEQEKAIIREKLTPPKPGKVLLYSCCAPCAGELMEAMTASEIDYSIYFYNPNIHPKKSMKLEKMKISVMLRNITYPLLTPITIQIIGLSVQKEWNGILNEVDGAPRVLI